MTRSRPAACARLAALLIDDAKLKPGAPRADRDRLVDVLLGLVRATEGVDDIDRKSMSERWASSSEDEVEAPSARAVL